VQLANWIKLIIIISICIDLICITDSRFAVKHPHLYYIISHWNVLSMVYTKTDCHSLHTSLTNLLSRVQNTVSTSSPITRDHLVPYMNKLIHPHGEPEPEVTRLGYIPALCSVRWTSQKQWFIQPVSELTHCHYINQSLCAEVIITLRKARAKTLSELHVVLLFLI